MALAFLLPEQSVPLAQLIPLAGVLPEAVPCCLQPPAFLFFYLKIDPKLPQLSRKAPPQQGGGHGSTFHSMVCVQSKSRTWKHCSLRQGMPGPGKEATSCTHLLSQPLCVVLVSGSWAQAGAEEAASRPPPFPPSAALWIPLERDGRQYSAPNTVPEGTK